MSRLSENKVKRFRQLSSHCHVRAAFDALLGIPGLWNGMNIGSLHRVLALNCDEVCLSRCTRRYMKLIHIGNRSLSEIRKGILVFAYGQ
jgi:hypothetical protein